MGISLIKILQEMHEKIDKNVLTSRPKDSSVKKFQQVTERLSKILKNPKVVNKEQLYNTESDTNMFKPSTIAKGDLVQHIGEYNGKDFKTFTNSLAKMYERAGFVVEFGYGSDDIKGFEIKEEDGEVVGEVDFLEKNSIPNYGDTIVIKYKK